MAEHPTSNKRLTDDQLLKVLLRYRMAGDGSYVDTDVVAACIELRERRDADEPAGTPDVLEALQQVLLYADFNSEESHADFLAAVEEARVVAQRAENRAAPPPSADAYCIASKARCCIEMLEQHLSSGRNMTPLELKALRVLHDERTLLEEACRLLSKYGQSIDPETRAFLPRVPWCVDCNAKHVPDCEVHHHRMADGHCSCSRPTKGSAPLRRECLVADCLDFAVSGSSFCVEHADMPEPTRSAR